MTLDERIEAAAKAIDPHVWSLEPPDHSSALLRQVSLWLARRYFEVLCPELFSSPPQAWLAPWEASGEDVQRFVNRTIENGYAAMRTAHLAQGSGE